MKKTISKISKILFAFALVYVSLFSNLDNVNAAAKPSIELGDSSALPGYIAGVKYNIKNVKNGGYAYCTNIHKNVARNTTANLEGTMDAGIAYILQNGYPNRSFTGDKQKDFYITQGAVWWYLDDTAGTNNLGNGYKSTGSDSYNIRPYVKQLVEGAKVARAQGYYKPSLDLTVSNTKMTLSSDKKYYVSKKINANAQNISDKFTVRLTSAPKGTIIVNTKGDKQTKFAPGEKFKIKVPASKIAEGKTVTVKVEVGAYRSFYKAYKYQPTDKAMQPVTVTEPFTYTVTDTIKLTATKPKTPTPPPTPTPSVNVVKVDAATGQTVSGATLVIKNANGQIVKTFTSSASGNKFTDLPAGKYTVQETVAPAGYKLNTTPVTFTINDNNPSVSVSVYNEPISPIVTINKVDSVTLKNIAGAEILVTNQKGEEVARFTSTSNSYTLRNLPYGTYTVEEVTAPEGYFLNNEKQTFTIDANHLSAQVTIKNIPKTCENGGYSEDECSVEVPNTGTNPTLLSLLGLTIISLGVGYVYKNNKKANK